MRRHRTGRRPLLSRTSALASVVALAGLASCQEIDTTRIAPYKATLGDDLYGVMCDRLGASSLTEDSSGDSYRAICHPTAAGDYGNEIDESILPPVSGDAKKARTRSLAKMRAMARWRSDLVRAFNATFPDVPIDNPQADGEKISLHDGLFALGQALIPLYEKDPFDAKADPLFPSSTRALSRVLDSLATSKEAQTALSHIWGRRGYRPFQVGLGAVRSALAYPKLREFTKASLAVLGPGGPSEAKLQQLFTTTKKELSTSQSVDSQLQPFRILDVNTAQPERPRTNLEFLSALMLDENAAYAADLTNTSRFIAKRDRRGFAIPFNNIPGQVGTVPSPFTDSNADGFADVDGFGRFMDGTGAPIATDLPFIVPGAGAFPTDEFGRPQTPTFEYINTSQTAIGAIARSVKTIADPQNQALMDALAGAHVLFGPREAARYDYTKGWKDAVLSPGEECPTVPADACLSYNRFKGEESPLVDLIYAAGPVLADEDSDALLLGLLDLIENHESEVARLLGAALKVRQIALDHDKLAEQGKEPFAQMAYGVPIWDEIADVLGGHPIKLVDDTWNITGEQRLLQKLVAGFADPVLVSPQGGSTGVGPTLATFIRMRDEFDYNSGNLNGSAVNLTDNAAGGSIADPKHPVDPNAPKTGKNRSLFERTLELIHLVNDVAMCNKPNAKVFMDIFGGTVLPIQYGECELVTFPDLAGLYLDAILPNNHPKRAKLEIQNDLLEVLLDVGGQVGIDPNAIFENSSGITGLTLTPTLPALNRFVYFGAQTGLYTMPDIDPFINGQNEFPNLFISNLIDPAPTSLCPKDGSGLNRCSSSADTLRVRGANTIFAWERLGFYSYLRPVVTPFAEVGCSADLSICPKGNNTAYYRGENYFIELIDILHRHWATDGGNTYEPILADAFESDLVPALVEFSKVATQLSKITIQRGPKAGQVWTGADVLAKTAQILFSQGYAKSIGLTDRKGNVATTWTNGAPQAQVTMYSLFADALHGLDVRFDTACDGLQGIDTEACKADAAARKAQWKTARSRLVDEFLSIDGNGPGATFHNKGTPKVLAKTFRLLREQLNANCPNRETGGGCPWARTELAQKLASTFSGPLFAALMDLQEALRADDGSRVATEQLLVYILSKLDTDDNLQASLASFADILQVLQNDGDLAPILRAIAPAAAPGKDPEGQGAGDAMIRVLNALTNDEYDPYHVMDHVLRAAVTPMNDGKDRAPLEIFIDAITDIHRIDAEDKASKNPLEPADYDTVFSSVSDFLTDETRGLEQFYFIVQNRPRE